MSKIRVIIADAQLEIIPKKLWKENAIVRDSNRRRRHPSKILLYTPIHYTAMLKHGIDIEKHGRPDITQDILKTITNHPISREKNIEIYIYTNKGELIWVNSKTRIPHNYYQFEGLIVQLLNKGKVPPDSGTLMRISNEEISKLLVDNAYLLHEEGEDIDKVKIPVNGDITFVVGGFQKGDYSEEFLKIKRRISIYKEALYAGTATCILLTKLWIMMKQNTPENHYQL